MTLQIGGVIGTPVRIIGATTSAVAGTAPANATVTIRRGGTVLGTATANGSGAWSYTVSGGISTGDIFTAEAAVRSAPFTVAPPPLTISGNPGAAYAGTLFSYTPVVVGGSGPRAFTFLGAIPSGYSFSSTTGKVIGTTSATGSFGVRIRVSDDTGFADHDIVIEVQAVPPDAIPDSFSIAYVTEADPLATKVQSFELTNFTVPIVATGTGGALFSLTDAEGSFVASLDVPPPQAPAPTRTVYVQAVASPEGNTGINRTVTVGGVSATFRIVTKEASSGGGGTDIFAISPKIAVFFDAKDPTTMWRDIEMTLPVIPNGTLAQRRVAAHAPKTPAHPDGDKALARFQPIEAKRPVFSLTAYGYGGIVPGLIYENGAYMKSPTPPVTIGPAGIPSMVIAFQRTSGDKIFSVTGQLQNYTDLNFNIGTFDNGSGGWGWGGQYAGVDYGHDYGSPDQPVNDYPARMFIEWGSDTSKTYFGKPDSAPKLVNTTAVITARNDLYFGNGTRGVNGDPGDEIYKGFYYFSNFLGNTPVEGREQHWVWLTAALTNTERAALDAAFKSTEGVLEPLTPTMKNHVTTGSVAKGSKVWTVASTAGMAPGDHLIMEANTPYQTIGPGGCIPSLSAANEAEIAAMTTSIPGTHIYARDTLRVFKAHPETEGYKPNGDPIFSTTVGIGYYAWDVNVFYTRYTQPLALCAVIETVDSPTQLTMSVAAVEACSNTNVFSDNHALLQGLVGPEGTLIDLEANNEGEFYLGDTWSIFARKGWTITGGQTDKVTLRAARGETGALISIFQCVNMKVNDLTLQGQREHLTYSRGKNNGDFSSPGIALEFSNCVDCTDTNIHVIEPQHAAIVYRNVNFGTNSGSKNAKVTVYTALQQYLAHWAWNTVNCSVPPNLDGYIFRSEYLEAALEAFQSDGIKLFNIDMENGRMALNTSKNCEVRGKIVIKPLARAVHTFSPYHVGSPILDVNNNVGGSQGGGEVGGGGKVRVDIDIQGWMDPQGNVPRAIASGSDEMLYDGTHDPTVANDGQRHGYIRAPYPKVGHDSYSAIGAQLAIGAANNTVNGYRFDSFSLPGSVVPTEYQPELLAYTTDGTVLTNNITGHSTQSISIVPTMSGNISGNQYAALT